MDDQQLQIPEELPEFDLDEIMKEFAPEEGEELAEELVEELVEEPAEEPEEAQPEEAVSMQDAPTVRFAAPVDEVTGDTIRLDRVKINNAQKVRDAAPIEEEEAPAEDTKEAFTEQWEPEYEQPMGQYVPPQPIIIHPRSRLRELKKKLVAGPEKRYYTLAEKGVGKLQAAIFLSALIVLLCAGSTVMYAMEKVNADRMRLMIFGQFFAMLVSALLGSFQLIEGVADLFKGRFTIKTLLVITFGVCCADAVLCLQELRVPCCAAFSLQMTMALGNTYHRRSAEMGQMDTMRKAVRLDGIKCCSDYYNGKKGFLRGDGEVEDFMDHYRTPSVPEKVMCWYALFAFLASAAIGVVAGLFHGLSAALQVGAVTLLAAAPASIFVTLTRPHAILVKKLHNVGAVICGWQGVKGLSGKAVFPLEYSDLFPAGSARMNGVKFYGNRQPDEIVAYCTAVVTANGSGLSPLFTQVLESRNGWHYDASELTCYDGGVGGMVKGEAVLVGPLSFLKEMGVEIPEGIRVNQAVCVAIDGQLCGLFALTYESNRSAATGLASLCGSRKMRPVIASGDFLLTDKFLHSRFNVKTKRILFPEHSDRAQLREKTADEGKPSLALLTRNILPAYAFCISGARAMRTACTLGLIVHMLGGILGIAVMVLLTLMGRLDLLTPANMFAYHLVWMIPGLLFTEWTRAS